MSWPHVQHPDFMGIAERDFERVVQVGGAAVFVFRILDTAVQHAPIQRQVFRRSGLPELRLDYRADRIVHELFGDPRRRWLKAGQRAPQ